MFSYGVRKQQIPLLCFFGGKHKHGTSRSKNLPKIKNKNAIYVTSKRDIEEVSAFINISWGQYTRAPPAIIYNRNRARLRQHELAVETNDLRGRRMTQSTLRKVNRGVQKYESNNQHQHQNYNKRHQYQNCDKKNKIVINKPTCMFTTRSW